VIFLLTGLIIPIGEWVLKTASKQLEDWYKLGITDCTLAINASVAQLQKPNFAKVVSKILLEIELSPKSIELEITESVLVELTHNISKNLSFLNKKGVKVSIDDFGTGYNSLKYIQKFPVDSIKIDRIFVSDIKSNVNKIIINSIISLGHKLNKIVIAEGVETKEQYEYLKELGCDIIQGYYFSKPLLPEEAVEYLRAN